MRGLVRGLPRPRRLRSRRMSATPTSTSSAARSTTCRWTQAETLVAYVHAIRQQYALHRAAAPGQVPPAAAHARGVRRDHPGLEVTDGQAQDERDQAFMNHLVQDRQLLWATGKVDSPRQGPRGVRRAGARSTSAPQDRRPLRSPLRGRPLGRRAPVRLRVVPVHGSAPAAGRRGRVVRRGRRLPRAPGDGHAVGLRRRDRRADRLRATTSPIDGDPEYYRRACDWMRLKWKSLQVFTAHAADRRHAYPDALAGLRRRRIEHVEAIVARVPIWEAGDFLRVQPLMRPQETTPASSTPTTRARCSPVVDATSTATRATRRRASSRARCSSRAGSSCRSCTTRRC
jgi:hypothetical protein